MFGRTKAPSLVKPKKLHSVEYLRYLYSVLEKNSLVNEPNCEIVVEAIRLIAEILIWGDQNDGTVMDFFLEKNMLEHFVKYLKQNPGRSLCVQLLQTLNILFENISNQTAIYYLLSSSHTNEIITHRYDFSDEEVVAYYVSFLKTLSLRLNSHTINFFYFEQRREFDLYVEAIKLFCHPESMVRIAVRTITLNVHRVKDEGALEFLHHQTSVPYFSYLVWSIGNTIMDIDSVLRSDLSPHCCSKLGDLVAEHVDHLHYVNDLLSLDIEAINEVLCDQLLHRLLIPLHVYSLTKRYKPSTHKTGVSRPHVCNPVAALMLLHTYLIIQHPNLIRILTEAIFLGDPSLTDLVPGWNRRLNPPSTSDNPDDQACGLRSDSETEEVDTDTDMSGDDFDPAMRIARVLLTATVAMRKAQSAAPGNRLSAYLEAECSLNRYPAFTQPEESLEACLRRAKGVTPALLASVWPTSLEPLKLTGKSKSLLEATVSIPFTIPDKTDISTHKGSESTGSLPNSYNSDIDTPPPLRRQCDKEHTTDTGDELPVQAHALVPVGSTPNFHKSLPTLDHITTETQNPSNISFDLQGRPFLRALYRALEVGPGTDYDTLFTLLLLQAIRMSKAIDDETLQLLHLSNPNIEGYPKYDQLLVGKLLEIVRDGAKAGSRVRLITLHAAMQIITELVCDASAGCQLSDEHFAQLISAREEAMMVLRSYFQNDAIFLDIFEHELRQVRYLPISLKKLAMDSNLLIPPLTASVLPSSTPSTSKPSSSPRTGIDRSAAEVALSRLERSKRLPQSQLEHTQHAIDVYLLIHIWLESLLRVRSDEVNRTHGEAAKTPTSASLVSCNNAPLFSDKLPVDLTTVSGLSGLGDVPDPKITLVHKAGDKLDLSSEALIGCTVESAGSHEKRFLVNYSQQLVLVEPDSRQMGWGVITFIGPLQDLEATCDPADSRCLHVNVNQPGHLSSVAYSSPSMSVSGHRHSATKPLLSARFLFEDHIRCMTARHMLLRGRELARQTKLRKIATLLDFSPQFIRDTFSSNGLSYASTTSNLTSLLEPATRAAAVRTRASAQSTSIDLSDDRAIRGNTLIGERKHFANRDPGSFLMERQNRGRAHRSYQEIDLSEGRMPLISLAGHAARLTPRQEPASQPIGESPRGSSPTSAHYRIGLNSVTFQNPPLFQQPITSPLQPPKFTLLPPPEENRIHGPDFSSAPNVSKSLTDFPNGPAVDSAPPNKK